MPDQFSNENNVKAHYKTTAEEIIKDTEKKLDVFIAGVGTGGTVSGVGKKLKEVIKDIYIVAVEPTALSPCLTLSVVGSTEETPVPAT